ncbi:uncharacterized protein LOC62_01G000262 [Vanrija pseudolonga]|uniref:Uncharacterized protein n=1 Tax=Vanrija pseudolonga TaxID=143232 RepID=A0AAF1BGR8_9TREE|nr:hypothetical protein LOC62_01G000262 [Vanrija pseudolonga]
MAPSDKVDKLPPLTPGGLIGALALFAALFAVSFLFVMPFAGALVRLRANYNPKAVGFADGDGEERYIGPRINGLLSCMKRTITIEGWYGLYKGWVAVTLGGLITIFVTAVFIGGTLLTQMSKVTPGTKVPPPPSVAGMIVTSILYIPIMVAVAVPCKIIEVRAITTPYRLPWSIKGSLNILLSDRERANPTALYRTPGLVVVVLLRSLVFALLQHGLKNLLGLGHHMRKVAPKGDSVVERAVAALADNADKQPAGAPTWRWAVFFTICLLSAAWETPLLVIMAKLCVQPNLGRKDPLGAHAPVPTNDEEELDQLEREINGHEEVDDALRRETELESLRLAGGNEDDVITLRPATAEPYAGFMDALRKIQEEEGTPALYRGWYFTSIGACMGM